MKKKSKKIGKKVGFINLKFPSYLTSHSKPQNVRKYIAKKERLNRMDRSPFNAWKQEKKISKKDLTWPQAKIRFPLLKPFKDADRDGVKNMFDCKPFDKKRQGFVHQYGFSDVASKNIRTVKMSPKKFLEETYKQAEVAQKKLIKREMEAKGYSLAVPYRTQERYEKRVIDPRSVAYQKKKIQSEKENVPIGFLTYEEGKPVSHEGRHAAKAAEELEMETIPITVESYKEEEAPEVEKLEPYKEQYGDYDLKDSDDKTLDYEEEEEE